MRNHLTLVELRVSCPHQARLQPRVNSILEARAASVVLCRLGSWFDGALSSSLCYNKHMSKKPLIETNPHLRDPKKYKKALIVNVATSTAIETGKSSKSIARMLRKHTNQPRQADPKAGTEESAQ